MPPRRFDCVCAGIVVADHLCEPIDHLPAAGGLVTTARLDLTIGGCAANVAVDLARLGANVAIAGKIGHDVFGRFIRESLLDAGVACDSLIESPTAQTSGTLVINVRGEDRRFVHAVGANAEFSGDEVATELIRSSRVLYLGGYLLAQQPTAERVAAMFRTAREAGVITVLDVVVPRPDDYWPRLRPVLPFTDVFLPNNDEAAMITGDDDPVRQAEAFRAAGAKTVVITCGDEGSVLAADGLQLRAGTYQVEFVDGTGSGDAFVAGYVYGILSGADIRHCLRLGTALGASCVRATGATSGVFTAAELLQFVSDRTLSMSE